ncbi:putative ABC transport system permease protein [Desulfotomaculum arcticum]|uniref:Putative ABC transport system permease protein n=1 Tax=Desulfotruncus arcticus DSM 17038 TaxID=1121424 RepID=A0A1I2UVV2_9FIRM|nr:iron export ABC transporter permease subunit FetB [Desulfotruncus arcticus]SFG81242.1 putative ABC transport system permease protein [Desulfotomaculum arcticum] [Desulfotruncus arcticus DSM 17038]
MDNSIIPISNFQLAFSVLLILITGGISSLLKLGLLKSLIWGTSRTFIQLTLVGYALTYIFQINNLWLIMAIITLMCYIASRAAVKRTPNVPDYPAVLAFLSLLASTYLVGTIVTVLIIAPDPWYSARIVIPMLGMILGNSMNGIAISLDRLYGEARSRAAEIEAMLTFGATPWEAVRSSVREAIRAGMTPTINSLMVVGLVSLPGMMTGQILGGADPREAVRYQIVVMLMIAAAVAIGCLILVGLSYKKLFNDDGALQSFVLQSRK